MLSVGRTSPFFTDGMLGVRGDSSGNSTGGGLFSSLASCTLGLVFKGGSLLLGIAGSLGEFGAVLSKSTLEKASSLIIDLRFFSWSKFSFLNSENCDCSGQLHRSVRSTESGESFLDERTVL